MKVLMIGPDPAVKGGVPAVIRVILENAPSHLQYTMVPTYTERYAAEQLRGKSLRYFLQVARNLRFLASALRDIRRLVRSGEYRLAHVHFASYGSTARKYFVARTLVKCRFPYILHEHGGRFQRFYNALPSPLQARVRWMIENASGMIVLAKDWIPFYQQLVSNPNYRFWHLPNAVRVPDQLPSPAEDETLKLLFLGRMDENKGSRRLLLALSRLPTEIRKSVHVYMAGSGEVEAMRALAAELGVQEQTTIRDWIDGSEKEQWLRETNAFILLSRLEGLPMAMLEAMAYGKALIVSPVGGIPEFVTDGQEGILVPPDDIDAISQAIAKLAENPDLRATMGRAARTRVEPLDVRHYMERLGQIYTEVLESAPRRSK
ncbi:MAG: glycosyltransferase family 4 protein [Fimbriimonadales bacterium]|nr:glycosyltransferase family 4 protein [Fimbriimonadales bacterium]